VLPDRPEGDASVLYGGVLHANGIALSPDGPLDYHSDTRAGVIFVHDIDRAGNSNRATHLGDEGRTAPTGWPSTRGRRGDRVRGRRPRRSLPASGRVERSVRVPARIVTSVCFAGADRCDLIVTTADRQRARRLRGCVLRTRVDVAGAPVHPARI
jgi:sugar lactone lactonase YvrE